MRFSTIKKVLFTILSCFSLFAFSQKSTLYGLSESSTGHYHAGAIWKIDSSRTKVSEDYSFRFPNIGHWGYYTLIEGSNGNLYGTTQNGGRGNNIGNIFKYDTTSSTYINLYNMTDADSVDAKNSAGGMLEATNGKFYGMARDGGEYGLGVLYEFDETTGDFKNLFSFDDTIGRQPFGELIQYTNGKLYGMVAFGTRVGNGVIFEYDIVTGMMTKKKYLSDYDIDLYPPNSFTLTKGNRLFATGIGKSGSSSGLAIFEYDVNKDSVIVHVNYSDSSFRRSHRNLSNDIIEDTSGIMYLFGNLQSEAIYSFNPSTHSLDTFGTISAKQHSLKVTDIVKGSDNKLYISAGAFFLGKNVGFLFSIDLLTKSVDSIYKYEGTPHCLLASNNKIYSMVEPKMYVYDIISKKHTVLIDRNSVVQPYNPRGKLTNASNDKVYGITRYGGAYGKGTLYEYDPDSKDLTTLIDFNDTLSVGRPNNSLIEGGANKLYAAATLLAPGYSSAIFEYDFVQDTLEAVHKFPDTANYFFPFAPAIDMVKAENDKLYGIIIKRSPRSECIFEFDPNQSTFDIKECYGFSDNSTGEILAASNGKLYFTTKKYGQNNDGALYEYDPEKDSLKIKYSFPFYSLFRKEPGRELIEVDSNRIMGFIRKGGVNNKGVLFEYNTSLDTLYEVFSFDSTSSNSVVYITKTFDGKVVGYTEPSSFNKKKGEIFEYDPSSRVYSAKYELKKVEEDLGKLIELKTSFLTAIQEDNNQKSVSKVWPNPVNNQLYVQLNSTSLFDIQIFTMDGKKVYDKRNIRGSELIIGFDYPKGAYVLTVESGSNVERHKIIKVF